MLAGATSPDRRVGAACKRVPDRGALTLVVVAYETPSSEQPSGRSVAIVRGETRAGRVRAAFKGAIREDGVMRLGPGSLSLDPARDARAPGDSVIDPETIARTPASR